MKLKTGVAILALSCTTAFAQTRPPAERWVGTWSTAVAPLPPAAPAPGPPPATAPAATTAPAPAQRPRLTIVNQTLRQIVHATFAGERVRVVFSNAYGTAPLKIGAAHVALRAAEAAIQPGTSKPLLFSGKTSTTIPPMAMMMSDPVDLRIPAFADVAVDLHLPDDVTAGPSPLTYHSVGLQTNYISTTGNHSGAAEFPVVTTATSWFALARVEVTTRTPATVIATFGDSITDGTRSTVNTNSRWPNVLARRLAKVSNGRYAIANVAISGNRLLGDALAPGFGTNALARFDRDVLVQPGVTHVVILEGINDIGMARQNATPAAEDVITAHKQLIERARTRGLKVIGGTLLPFEGAAYFTKEGEAKRSAVNQWIRTSKAYDAVIDFDALMRDPAQPTRMKKEFDSGDALHPNDAGYAAMGNAIDLALFR